MAGDHNAFKVDPAVERWQAMHSTMYERFRLTPSKTRVALVLGAIIPLFTYSVAKYSDDRWEWRAKTREDSLLRNPPKPAEGSEE